MVSSPATVAPASEAETYQWLECRPQSWRKQLFLKGRNIAVGQLIYSMRANHLTPDGAVFEYDLPLAQVQEAMLYYQRHRDIIEADSAEERRWLEANGVILDPPPISR